MNAPAFSSLTACFFFHLGSHINQKGHLHAPSSKSPTHQLCPCIFDFFSLEHRGTLQKLQCQPCSLLPAWPSPCAVKHSLCLFLFAALLPSFSLTHQQPNPCKLFSICHPQAFSLHSLGICCGQAVVPTICVSSPAWRGVEHGRQHDPPPGCPPAYALLLSFAGSSPCSCSSTAAEGSAVDHFSPPPPFKG